MANPTVPFSWQMPEPTDLVTDLPADFEVFGQAVATSMQDLLGGTTGQVLAKASDTDMDFVWSADAAGMTNPMTTTADVIYSSSGSTPARLGIGTVGQVLQVNSGATAPEWTTPAVSSLDLDTIASGSMPSATSLSITGLTQDFFMLRLTGLKFGVAQPDSVILQLNSNTGANYTFTGNNYNAANFDYERLVATTRFKLNLGGAASNDGNNSYMIQIQNGKADGFHTISVVSNFTFNNTGAQMGYTMMGSFEDATAITSIQIKCDSGYTFTAGTYKLIGG